MSAKGFPKEMIEQGQKLMDDMIRERDCRQEANQYDQLSIGGAPGYADDVLCFDSPLDQERTAGTNTPYVEKFKVLLIDKLQKKPAYFTRLYRDGTRTQRFAPMKGEYLVIEQGNRDKFLVAIYEGETHFDGETLHTFRVASKQVWKAKSVTGL